MDVLKGTQISELEEDLQGNPSYLEDKLEGLF